jgi:hypothetical protein
MANSLKFKGYDYHFSYGVHTHDQAAGNAALPESLPWLWRGYDPTKTMQDFVQIPKKPQSHCGAQLPSIGISMVNNELKWTRRLFAAAVAGSAATFAQNAAAPQIPPPGRRFTVTEAPPIDEPLAFIRKDTIKPYPLEQARRPLQAGRGLQPLLHDVHHAGSAPAYISPECRLPQFRDPAWRMGSAAQ